jgi:hypothetical protein
MDSTEHRDFHARSVALTVGSVLAAMTIMLNSIPRQTADFWAAVSALSAVEAEHFTSLDGMAASADLTVLGEIVSVTEGRLIGDPFAGDGSIFVEAELRVDEIVLGRAADTRPIRLEFFVPGADALEAALRLPDLRKGLFLLRNKGLEAASLGYPVEYQVAESAYYRLITFGGFLADDRGMARTYAALYPYLRELDGNAFGDVLARVRRAAEG